MKLHTPVSLAAIACWLCLLSACGGSAGSDQTTPNSPGVATPPPGPVSPNRNTVHGEVFSFETGVIPDAAVNLFFWNGRAGYSYWYYDHPLHTDGLGQFEAYLPDSTFNVLAFRDGFVQPCAYFARVVDGEDIEARIEMIPVASLNAVDPPRPQLSFEPSVTGSIFENTPNGRVAVAGAALWAEDSIGVGLATTASDLAGGFYMCNLPADTSIYVGKDGFEPRWIAIDGTEPVVLEVALERETP